MFESYSSDKYLQRQYYHVELRCEHELGGIGSCQDQIYCNPHGNRRVLGSKDRQSKIDQKLSLIVSDVENLEVVNRFTLI